MQPLDAVDSFQALAREGEEGRAAECQADVMAATLVISDQALDGSNIYPLLNQLAESLGATAHVDGSHPSLLQRKRAIREQVEAWSAVVRSRWG